MLVVRTHSLFAAFLAVGCGGTVALNDNAGDPPIGPTATQPSGHISLITLDASPPPSACVACTVNRDCGSGGAACVKSADGRRFCAPGCNKEGFCTPDRVCQWVTDPEGQPWRACAPLEGGQCAVPDVPPARLRTAHTGTW